MAGEPDAQHKESSENIEVPPIPKETAGAVAGAALGSMMGPAGAVGGGNVEALAGKAAGEGRLKPAVKKTAQRVLNPAKKAPRAKRAKRKPARRPAKSR